MYKMTKYMNVVFIFCIFLVLIIYGSKAGRFSLQDLLEYTPESLVLSAIVLIGFYCLKSVIIFIPLAVLFIGAGIIFPLGWAFALTYFCLLLESTISFLLGRRLGSKRVLALINQSERGKKILEFTTNNSIFTCCVLKMIPGPPIELTNMFVGTTDIKYSHFIVGTLLGHTPGMIPLVLMGEAAWQPLSLEFLIPFAVSVVLTLSLTGGYLWRKKQLREKND